LSASASVPELVCGMQAVPLLVVVGGGAEWVVVGGGAEWVVGGGAACVVGGGVECVVVAALVVVVGAEVVVVCVAWCGLAFLGFVAGFFAVVVVVGVVSAFGVVVEVDDEAPQPAATSASDAALRHRIGSRLIRILEIPRRLRTELLPDGVVCPPAMLRDPDLGVVADHEPVGARLALVPADRHVSPE